VRSTALSSSTPRNASPWPRIGREPSIVDGDNPECCIRLAWQRSYAELHRSAPIGQPRCVVVSSADGRWSRRLPRSRSYAPLTLAEVDQFWQASQREWVHRLSAAHVVADTADHFVHRDEPALVAHVVAAVVESSRSGGPVVLNPSAVAAHGGRLEAAGG
jgi:hypothetical protein